MREYDRSADAPTTVRSPQLQHRRGTARPLNGAQDRTLADGATVHVVMNRPLTNPTASALLVERRSCAEGKEGVSRL